MFEQTFKNIDDVLWKEAGCTTELDYTEQTSWILFLKYLDDLEHERAQTAELHGKPYSFIIDPPHRWSKWAAPKTKDGAFDHNKALTGPDLIAYVDGELFPYLRGFKSRAERPDTIEYKIGEIFGEIKNKFQSGYSLRDALELVDQLRFRSQAEKHELSHLYEAKIKNMGNAGRNGGEYYTPRPLIRAMIKIIKPKIGEKIYDGACGSAGFLCESYDYLRAKPGLSTGDLKRLQERTFYGKEKKSLAYVIAIMNMILHGIDAPNILHTNTLAENISDIQEKDRFDVILANPPFGGKERAEVQQNFPIKTGETAFLFLQHFIKSLKAGGRVPMEDLGINQKTIVPNKTKPLEEVCGSYTYFSDGDVLLAKITPCFENGKLGIASNLANGIGFGSSEYIVFRPSEVIDKEWLYYFLSREAFRIEGATSMGGAVGHQRVAKEFVDSYPIPVPSIDEQRRIVAILDEAFAGLEVLRANTEKNLANARALFESYLNSVFSHKGDGWRSSAFEDCIEDVKYTTKIQRKQFLERGKLPIISQEAEFTNGYWNNEADAFKVSRPVVIFGDHTKILKYIDFDFVLGADGVKILVPRRFLFPKFFYYVLRSISLKSLGYSRHYRLLKEAQINFPDINEQESVAEKLDALAAETTRLEAIYQQKLTAIAELKQSILQQAFSGELTSAPEKALAEAGA